jgi:hypothetical protein
VGAVVVTATHQ